MDIITTITTNNDTNNTNEQKAITLILTGHILVVCMPQYIVSMTNRQIIFFSTTDYLISTNQQTNYRYGYGTMDRTSDVAITFLNRKRQV